MKLFNIFALSAVVFAQSEAEYDGDYGPDGYPAPMTGLKSSTSGGVDRVERVVARYNNWIENYGQEYKKTPKLTRAVERLRKYFTWWMRGNKKGCRPAGVDRMELEFLDEDINRTLPDNAMLKIYTYQSQIKRVQALFFSECDDNVNGKLNTVVAKVTRDLTKAFQAIKAQEAKKQGK